MLNSDRQSCNIFIILLFFVTTFPAAFFHFKIYPYSSTKKDKLYMILWMIFEILSLKTFLQNCVTFFYIYFAMKPCVREVWHPYMTFENNHFLILRKSVIFIIENATMKENEILEKPFLIKNIEEWNKCHQKILKNNWLIFW